MEAQVRDCYERIKHEFLDKLDRFFDAFSLLISQRSAYSKFGALVEHFQDAKNDHEMGDRPEAELRLRLLKSIRHLFGFERIAEHFSLETESTIQARLVSASDVFQAGLERLEAAVNEFRLYKLQPLLGQDDSDEQGFQDELRFGFLGSSGEGALTDDGSGVKLISVKLDEFAGEQLARQIRQKRNGKWPAQVTFVDKHKNYPFQPRRCHVMNTSGEGIFETFSGNTTSFYLKKFDWLFTGNGLEPHRPELLNLDWHPARFRRKGEHSGLKRRNSRLVDSHNHPIRFRRCVESNSRRSRQIRKQRRYLLGRLKGRVDQLSVSASDKYAAIRMLGDQAFRLFDILRTPVQSNWVELGLSKEFDVLSFAFVDCPGHEKVVFVDPSKLLRVCDLDTGRVEHTFDCGAGFLAVYYLDPQNVLALTVEYEFAVCSLQSYSVSDSVALEDNFSEEFRLSRTGRLWIPTL